MDKKKSGAKPKYEKPTVMVSFRCPENKIKDFKDKAKAILNTYRSDKQVENNVNVPKMKNPPPPPEKKCLCYLDANGLLRRGKDGCKKSKEEHKF